LYQFVIISFIFRNTVYLLDLLENCSLSVLCLILEWLKKKAYRYLSLSVLFFFCYSSTLTIRKSTFWSSIKFLGFLLLDTRKKSFFKKKFRNMSLFLCRCYFVRNKFRLLYLLHTYIIFNRLNIINKQNKTNFTSSLHHITVAGNPAFLLARVSRCWPTAPLIPAWRILGADFALKSLQTYENLVLLHYSVMSN